MATITKRKWTTSKGEPREAWVLAFTDAMGERHKEQFAKKRDADARRIEVESQVTTGTYRADAATKTVHDACVGYLENLRHRREVEESVTEHYQRTTEAQLYNYVSPQPDRAVTFGKGIGSVKLAQLTSRVVTDFKDDLRKSGVGVVTTRRILGSLSRAIKYAKSQDWIAINPVEGVTVNGKRGERSKKVTPPSKAALATLIKEADADMGMKVKFAAASGLRASEQWALPWGNLDLTKGEVFVDRRVDAYGNIDVTKSDAGTRTIPLGAPIVRALKEWKLKAAAKGDEDLVFPSPEGSYTQHNNFGRRHWRPLINAIIVKDANFKIDGWHALRHFAISTWIEAGLKPKTVQTFAGHSSLAVTMDRYGHLFPADQHQEAMDRIANELFA